MGKFRWIIVLIITLIIAVNPGLAWAAEDEALEEIQYILSNYYVEEVPLAVLNAPTIEQALEALGDEHTKYWTKEDYASFLDNMEPHFAGLGIYIEAVAEGMRVLAVIEDSPAQLAEIKAGDIILSVNEVALKGNSAEEGQKLLMGPENSKANLVIKRGNSLLDYTVTRAMIELPTVTGEVIDGHIGYIDINSFAQNTHREFDRLLRDLDKKADVWIVDLRNNTGGYFNTALALAGYFIGDDVALYMEEKEYVTEYEAYKQSIIIDEPVILLINGNSASSSEILAGALKDHKKAFLVGERTYGKGSVQSIFELANGGFLKVTVAHFYSPAMQVINGVGIEPDVEVAGNGALDRARLLIGLDERLRTSGIETISH